MSFLQPLFLIALPLIALPVIIHLINQRRYQTVQWAAMMFLLTANRMSRGYAKLRQWLILLFRVLVILGLLLALSRPLASGRVGMVGGGQPDTTIILLDRSPSMQQRGSSIATSKLTAGRSKLSDTLGQLGSTRWVLVDSATNVAQEIESPASLLQLPSVEACDTSADLPLMLETARDYIEENRTGRTEIWICSDVRDSDWRAESGQWQALRDAFSSFAQGIRFHLLAYTEPASGNLGIRVTSSHQRQTPTGAKLLVSLLVSRDSGETTPLRLPIGFEIEGARSELTIEMASAEYELRDYEISLDDQRQRGWGKVSIPADTNPADNEFYFVFDEPVARRTIVVSADPLTSRALQLVASIAPDPSVECVAEVLPPAAAATVDWETAALVIWHAPLPKDEVARTIEGFVNRGGQIVFLPPETPGNQESMGVRWGRWTEAAGAATETWRGDQDVLSHDQSGTALPLGDLAVHRSCELIGEVTPLATLIGGQPLLARLPTDRGGVYFCCTTPNPGDSSLATDGVVLYVFLHRAIAAGAEALSDTHQLESGDPGIEGPDGWQQVDGPAETLSINFAHHRGIYRSGDQLLAVNRSDREDDSPVLAESRVAALFAGLNYSRVDDQIGSFAGLMQEVWRLFLFAMMFAVLAEAILCMPRRKNADVGHRDALRGSP